MTRGPHLHMPRCRVMPSEGSRRSLCGLRRQPWSLNSTHSIQKYDRGVSVSRSASTGPCGDCTAFRSVRSTGESTSHIGVFRRCQEAITGLRCPRSRDHRTAMPEVAIVETDLVGDRSCPGPICLTSLPSLSNREAFRARAGAFRCLLRRSIRAPTLLRGHQAIPSWPA
jgi:hypothetical protein